MNVCPRSFAFDGEQGQFNTLTVACDSSIHHVFVLQTHCLTAEMLRCGIDRVGRSLTQDIDRTQYFSDVSASTTSSSIHKNNKNSKDEI